MSEKYNFQLLWGEGSPEIRAKVEEFWRSPQGQERLRKMQSEHQTAPELVHPSAVTKDVKEP